MFCFTVSVARTLRPTYIKDSLTKNGKGQRIYHLSCLIVERRSQGIFHTPCLIVKKKTKEVLRHREPKNRASTEAIILHHTYSIPHILNITGSNLIELYCIEWFCCVINSLFLYHPRFELFHHCLIFCVICVLFCISPVFFFCVAPFSFLYIIRI